MTSPRRSRHFLHFRPRRQFAPWYRTVPSRQQAALPRSGEAPEFDARSSELNPTVCSSSGSRPCGLRLLPRCVTHAPVNDPADPSRRRLGGNPTARNWAYPGVGKRCGSVTTPSMFGKGSKIGLAPPHCPPGAQAGQGPPLNGAWRASWSMTNRPPPVVGGERGPLAPAITGFAEAGVFCPLHAATVYRVTRGKNLPQLHPRQRARFPGILACSTYRAPSPPPMGRTSWGSPQVKYGYSFANGELALAAQGVYPSPYRGCFRRYSGQRGNPPTSISRSIARTPVSGLLKGGPTFRGLRNQQRPFSLEP